jgi:branched-chain amino acid transport system substrate-binding protein
MSEKRTKKVSRRKFIGLSTAAAAGGVVGGLVIGGVAGYFGGQMATPPQTITNTATETKTATSTITTTVGGAPTTQTVTQTVTQTATGTQTAPRTIKIGATVSATGIYAVVVGPEYNQYLKWADYVNARGGLYVAEYKMRLPVQAIVYDDKSDVPTVQKYYEKLCSDDKVDMLIGPMTAPPAIAASAIAERYQIPYIDNKACEIPAIENKKWVVFNMDIMATWLVNYIDMLVADGRVKTLSFINIDDPFGNEVNGGGKEYGDSVGLKTLLWEKITNETTDFTPIIAKLKSLDPDVVIFCTNSAIPDATFWKQCWDLNYKPRDYHSCFGFTKGFTGTVGDKLTNWTTTDPEWTSNMPFQGKWGIKAYFDILGETYPSLGKLSGDPNGVGVLWEDYPMTFVTHHCLELAANAIELAGTLDKNKINETMHKMDVQTIWGDWKPKNKTSADYPWSSMVPKGETFTGIPDLRHVPFQWQNGERVILWPPELATGKYVYPAPWGT